ncbi:TetR/AcrR family transcriptional regulator [Novispirillum itersonii]|uniref:TetR/AcrR family transcriptional regulator n=1 Tax=Novispirillum itersonii TaxID=189 RepID=UPI000379070F|nr:TetR/AcrR family transcriptional regulator [Novispirillum itersonii]
MPNTPPPLPPPDPAPEKPTRDRILDAAAKLFQASGVRAVSVDAVASRAGVTKRTLYYHFRSKDDLIAAYLSGRDAPNLTLFRQWYDRADGDCADRTAALFRGLAQAVRHPKWKGCGFLRTAVELITLPGHPAVVAARRHKHRVEDWLTAAYTAVYPPDVARALARQVCLLIDGAFALVMLHRDPAYMDCAGQAAAALLRSSLPGQISPDADQNLT